VFFDLGQVVQIHRPGKFDDVEGFPINDLALLCERNKKVLPLLTCREDKSRFLGDEDDRRRFCGFLTGLKLDNQFVFHGFNSLSCDGICPIYQNRQLRIP
jgi:hypothetical protein